MSQFSKTITKLRKEQNLTQKEMAERLNIKQNTISMWETGKRTPLVIDVVKITTVLNISPQELTLLLLKDVTFQTA